MFNWNTVTDEQVIKEFDKRGYPKSECGLKRQTPYGVTFAHPTYMKPYIPTWLCIYDSMENTALAPYAMKVDNMYAAFWLEQYEIIRLIKAFEKRPKDFNPFTKPHSILTLEQILGVKAYLHDMNPFQWHIRTDSISCVNNPFNLSHCYSDSEDNFEVLLDTCGDVMQFVPLKRLVTMIK
jgi:hypothetical protein